MIKFEFGEIVLINFEPSVGKEYKKVRPALVIQSAEVGKNSPYVTVMPISSKVENLMPQDVFIQKDFKNKLMSDSVGKVSQISSFDKIRFIKRIGEINSPISRKVRGYLRKHFEL